MGTEIPTAGLPLPVQGITRFAQHECAHRCIQTMRRRAIGHELRVDPGCQSN